MRQGHGNRRLKWTRSMGVPRHVVTSERHERKVLVEGFTKDCQASIRGLPI